jgi:hypothetical protein
MVDFVGGDPVSIRPNQVRQCQQTPHQLSHPTGGNQNVPLKPYITPLFIHTEYNIGPTEYLPVLFDNGI